MALWMPLAIAGGSWLANKLFGGSGSKPQPPNINAPQYQPSIDTSAWLKSGQQALQQQTSQWLENAMRSYRGAESGRGWNPYTSSGGIEFGDRASQIAAQNLSTGLANLEAQAAQMQQAGKLQGMQQYAQDYNQWLAATQGQSGQFLGSLMQLLGQMDWK